MQGTQHLETARRAHVNRVRAIARACPEADGTVQAVDCSSHPGKIVLPASAKSGHVARKLLQHSAVPALRLFPARRRDLSCDLESICRATPHDGFQKRNSELLAMISFCAICLSFDRYLGNTASPLRQKWMFSAGRIGGV